VQAEHSTRILGRRSDFHDRDARRVRRKNGVGIGDDLVQLGKDLALDGLVFDDRLDHELTVSEVGQIGRELQPREGSVAIGFTQLAFGRGTLQRLGEAAVARGHQLVRRLIDDDVRAGLGRHLGDARTHLPGADDADSFDAHYE
jgi:hypothetical protein